MDLAILGVKYQVHAFRGGTEGLLPSQQGRWDLWGPSGALAGQGVGILGVKCP